jgi:hypothetical protein
MLEKIVTGGQTGVEQAAWAAARRAGIATGGYMPRGFANEDGPSPRLGALYGAVEFPMDEARRIRANLRRAEALLWLGDALSPQAEAMIAACRELGKPFLVALPGVSPASEAASWLAVFEVKTLVVAGPPASQAPQLGAQAARFLDQVLIGRRPASGGVRRR